MIQVPCCEPFKIKSVEPLRLTTRAREAGFHAHIKKPFDATTVIAAVEAAVRYRKEQPPAAIAPEVPQTPHPAGKPARTERRLTPRGGDGNGAGRPARGQALAANRDDARQSARASPKRHP